MEQINSTQSEGNNNNDSIWNDLNGKTYEIMETLGQGAYGTVVKAKHKETGQIVAIKLIESIQKDTYMLRKVIRELFVLRKLSCIETNIYTTKIIDVILPAKCSSKNDENKEVFDLDALTYVFVVMEKSDFDLKNMMDNLPQEEIDEDTIITILYNILSAVHYIHSTNLIHRDLKPANILMDNDCQIKICDFGLARHLPKPEKSSKDQNSPEQALKNIQQKLNLRTDDQTQNQQFKQEMTEQLKQTTEYRQNKKRDLSPQVQTRWYRSPEVILLQKQYFDQSDIYSVGMILCELMKASNVYNKSNSSRYLFQGKSCYPISPAASDNPSLVSSNDQLIKIIERYPSLDVAADLSHLVSDDAIQYVQNCLSNITFKGDLKDKFSKSDPRLVKILKEMLEFNPYFRPSAKQLLKSQLFDELRKPTDKTTMTAPYRIKLKLDEKEDMIDYENNDFRNDLKTKLLKTLVKECKKIKEKQTD